MATKNSKNVTNTPVAPLATKNVCGKTVTRAMAYEIWQTPNELWTWYVLKKYQSPFQEARNPYARWFCDVVSPFVPDGELGDAYAHEIKGVAFKLDYNPANPDWKPIEERGV